MSAVTGTNLTVIPFCECFHKPDYEGGRPLGKDDDGVLTWGAHECDVLDSEQVYAVVAGHRRECRLQPELLPTERSDGGPARPRKDGRG